MNKITLLVFHLLLICNIVCSQNSYNITNIGMTFSPDTLFVAEVDTINFTLGSTNNAVEVDEATFLSVGNTSNGGFNNPFGGGKWIADNIKTYYYVCQPHTTIGRKVTIIVTDCNGIVNGLALTDTCGTCHKAYVYDFVTHSVAFIDDTLGLVLGATEMLVLPDNPQNPYWNDCSIDCNGIVNGLALTDTCGTCHQAYVYDFVTHSVAFIDDTLGLVLGATEMLVLPDNPQNPYWNDCGVTFIQPISIIKERELVKVIDLLGRENKATKNQPLFYIYDDGTVEKRIIIE